MNLYESAEDYLERILMLQQENGNVRAIDIAHSLNFSKASVSIAMKKLLENGYITMDGSSILLTKKGLEIANKVYEKHTILSNFLICLGVNDNIAKADACKIEHDLSDEAFAAIKNHYLKIKDN